MTTLTIGGLAKAAGVGVETVRYYERQGLIRQPPKPEKGYRCYSPETVVRIRFIKRNQSLGFTLKEIGGFFTMVDDETIDAKSASRALEKKMVQIEEKIRAFQETLEILRSVQKSLLSCSETNQSFNLSDCLVAPTTDEIEP